MKITTINAKKMNKNSKRNEKEVRVEAKVKAHNE